MSQHPAVFDVSEEATKYAKVVLQNLGIDLVVKPRRIIQVITPNKIHQSISSHGALYLVLPPQGDDLNRLQGMCSIERDKVKEKLVELQIAQGRLLEENTWLKEMTVDEGNNLS